MAKRKGIGKRRRFEIFERDGFACRYCGKTPPGVILHVDHIVAVVNGGTNDPANLITSCSDCNLGKGRKVLEASAPLDYQGMADETAERAAQVAAYAQYSERLLGEQDRMVDIVGRAFFSPELPENLTFAEGPWRNSVRYLLKNLSLDQIVDAARSACHKVRDGSRTDRFKYFYAICRNKIQGRSTVVAPSAQVRRPWSRVDLGFDELEKSNDHYYGLCRAEAPWAERWDADLTRNLIGLATLESIVALARDEGLLDEGSASDAFGIIYSQMGPLEAASEALAGETANPEIFKNYSQICTRLYAKPNSEPFTSREVLEWIHALTGICHLEEDIFIGRADPGLIVQMFEWSRDILAATKAKGGSD